MSFEVHEIVNELHYIGDRHIDYLGLVDYSYIPKWQWGNVFWFL